jgi:hypothetical protein
MPLPIPVKESTPCGRTKPATWESSIHSVAITNTVGIMHGMIEFLKQQLLPEVLEYLSFSNNQQYK